MAILIGTDGKAIPCWEPIPGQYLAVIAFPNWEDVVGHYRRTCDPAHPISGAWLRMVDGKAG